jgi:hypothetical protein
MPVCLGGRERTSDEFRMPSDVVRLRLNRVIPAHSLFGILEGESLWPRNGTATCRQVQVRAAVWGEPLEPELCLVGHRAH